MAYKTHQSVADISPMQGKIRSLHDIALLSKNLKKNGKRIVLCHGVFDLLHPGHIRHFHSAKKHGDILIVTITADDFVKKGPGRPIFPQDLRAEVLANLSHVDYVAIVGADSAVEPIRKIKPHIYVKGPDYKNREIKPGTIRKLDEELKALEKIGGKLVFTDDVLFSSSHLINTYLESYPEKTKHYLSDFRSRHTAESIVEKLSLLSGKKVLVIGDAMIDQYHYCLPMGKSSKEPIIVHRYTKEESFIGGALATACHTSSLVGSVTLVTTLGKKRTFEEFIRKHLTKHIKPVFFYQKGHTIIKRRFLDPWTRQKLFQIEFLEDENIEDTTEDRIFEYLTKQLASFDLVVVNDFGHGMLTERLRNLICRKAKFLALNVQANSANYGFNVVTKYRKANFVCIDEQELRLATHDRYSDVTELIKKIYRQVKCDRMIVTKGPKGSISYNAKDGFSYTPSLTEKVVDRVGAGDALFAITAPLVASGWDQDLAAFVGNVAGALKVQTVGNKRPVLLDDMSRFITRLLK